MMAKNETPKSSRFRTLTALSLAGLAAAVLLGAPAAFAGDGSDGGVDGDAYVQEIQTWHEQRLERLERPDGWLTLAGLFWLREGKNSCGSDEANSVVLPKSAAPVVGVFDLAGDGVTFTPQPGVEVLHEGKPLAETLTLRSDQGGAPTLLEHGSVLFFVIYRDGRLAVRVKDSQSPTRLEFKGIETYPVDRKWRIDARYEPHQPAKKVPVPNALGKVDEESSPGALVFELDGAEQRLDVLEGADESELFVIFADTTNGKETYGGGRFLYANLGDDDHVVLDFNRAYNPPCAFTPYATCPLPPRQNRMTLAVTAGEKKYGEGHH